MGHPEPTFSTCSKTFAENKPKLDTQNKAEAVMVGDRAFDIEGARVHNLPCIAVRWGYAEPGELETLDPKAIIDSPHEFP